MAKTIFEQVTAEYIASYWNNQDPVNPLLTEELFPNVKQLGRDLAWIQGAKGLPTVLKMSAFDVAAVPRPRIGVTEMKAQMPLFKESYYVDEDLRQQLNQVQASGKDELVKTVLVRIFDDIANLIRGAAARREQMRMMALTSGGIAFESNGQIANYDYQVKHKVSAPTAWSQAGANPLQDILNAKNAITGDSLTRAMSDIKSWVALRTNSIVRASIFGDSDVAATRVVTDAKLDEFLLSEYRLKVTVNQSKYDDGNGNSTPYMPENTFVMFPDGNLGNTYFGTTPEESDLMNGMAANVAIVDTGVAVTTIQEANPVQINTVVSQICLPTLVQANSIYILDTAR
ncbi:MAG: major capsid protein [Planctomycetaceae bacterium]|jgi:hypothetical protein|nr:major capsid protein [Planctomycetaceae bacterium]